MHWTDDTGYEEVEQISVEADCLASHKVYTMTFKNFAIDTIDYTHHGDVKVTCRKAGTVKFNCIDGEYCSTVRCYDPVTLCEKRFSKIGANNGANARKCDISCLKNGRCHPGVTPMPTGPPNRRRLLIEEIFGEVESLNSILKANTEARKLAEVKDVREKITQIPMANENGPQGKAPKQQNSNKKNKTAQWTEERLRKWLKTAKVHCPYAETKQGSNMTNGDDCVLLKERETLYKQMYPDGKGSLAKWPKDKYKMAKEWCGKMSGDKKCGVDHGRCYDGMCDHKKNQCTDLTSWWLSDMKYNSKQMCRDWTDYVVKLDEFKKQKPQGKIEKAAVKAKDGAKNDKKKAEAKSKTNAIVVENHRPKTVRAKKTSVHAPDGGRVEATHGTVITTDTSSGVGDWMCWCYSDAMEHDICPDNPEDTSI